MLFSFCDKLHNQANGLKGIAMPHQCNTCGKCASCPSGIDIPKLMTAYDAFEKHGRKPLVFFSKLGVQPSILKLHCLDRDCAVCERQCPQHLPVKNRIEQIGALVHQREVILKQALNGCFGDAEGKKVGVYPAGALANEMWTELLRMGPIPAMDILFFDSNPERASRTPIHKSAQQAIYPAEDIIKMSVQRIIIASDKHYEAIYERLKKYENFGVEFRRFSFGDFYAE
jgi:hypothetical protein